MRLWRYQGANALGKTLEPCICRWRYGNVKKSYKNQRKFGESKYIRIFAMLKKTRVLTVSDETIKTKKL
jgi:hypothetical protein